MFLLLIPESRKRPITESLLYKQIVRFFEEEGIADKFEIKFIEIPQSNLPPKNFRSGRSWVSKAQIDQMANSIVEYLKANSYKLKAIAYVRGAYLEAIRKANEAISVQRLGCSQNEKLLNAIRYTLNPIQEIFTDDELAQLKKKGIRWMKIGLRMEEAFNIFKRRIKEIINEGRSRQLRLF